MYLIINICSSELFSEGLFFNFKKSMNQLLQFILIFLIKGKQMVSKVTDFFFFFLTCSLHLHQ